MPTDTLAGIAIKYNVSIEDLKRENGLHKESDLWLKNQLNIPEAVEAILEVKYK